MYAPPAAPAQNQVDALTEAQSKMVHVGSSWGMPDYSTVLASLDTIPGTTTGSTYTATQDCLFRIITTYDSGVTRIDLNGVNIGRYNTDSISFPIELWLRLGDFVHVYNESGSSSSPGKYVVYGLIKDSGQTAAVPTVREYVDERVAEEVDERSLYSAKGTATTTGNWTITGLTPWKPMIIILSAVSASSGAAIATAVSGVAGDTVMNIIWGRANDSNRSNDHIFIPTATTAVMNVTTLTGTLTAYQ
jgi:hypothetical protein